MSDDLMRSNRRKDSQFEGTKLPQAYLKLVENVFNKNFAQYLVSEKNLKERFITDGELYPDELMLVVSLRNPQNIRATTCYASVDYPAARFKSQTAKPSESVEFSVNQCVDAIASFFQTFFQEQRPVDYDLEYTQAWTPFDLDKNTRVFLRINRDSPDLEAQADELLRKGTSEKPLSAAETRPTSATTSIMPKKKKQLH